MLPNSLILCKYNDSTKRFELYSQNKQAREEFGIENSEQFYQFAKRIVLNSYSKHKEMKEKLEEYREPAYETTLYGQIITNLEKEIKQKKQIPLVNEKKQNCENDKINSLNRKNSFESKRNKEENQLLNSLNMSKMTEEKRNNNIQEPLKNIKNVYFLKSSLSNVAGKEREFSEQDRNMLKFQKNNGHSSSLSHQTTFAKSHQDLEGDMKEIDQYQGHLINDQYIPIPNKKFSVRLITFYLNDYFSVISLQRDDFREKFLCSISEIKKDRIILDNSFSTLNSFSVSAFKITKDLFLSKAKQAKNIFVSYTPSSNSLNSLLFYVYSLKQVVYNTFEWMKRKKKGMNLCRNKINIQETILGITKIFEGTAEEKSIQFDVKIDNSALKETVNSNERILNQILYNLIKYCIEYSLNEKDVQIIVHKNFQKDSIKVKLMFSPQEALNFSYLNCADINDENELNFLGLMEIKISKHILKHLNPKGQIYFTLTENNQCQISFNIPTNSSSLLNTTASCPQKVDQFQSTQLIFKQETTQQDISSDLITLTPKNFKTTPKRKALSIKSIENFDLNKIKKLERKSLLGQEALLSQQQNKALSQNIFKKLANNNKSASSPKIHDIKASVKEKQESNDEHPLIFHKELSMSPASDQIVDKKLNQMNQINRNTSLSEIPLIQRSCFGPNITFPEMKFSTLIAFNHADQELEQTQINKQINFSLSQNLSCSSESLEEGTEQAEQFHKYQHFMKIPLQTDATNKERRSSLLTKPK